MFDKIKKMFSEKDDKKKTENLVAFLIILVITLIVINKILTDGQDEEIIQNQSNDAVLVSEDNSNITEISLQESNLSQELEDILSRITGVRGSSSFNNIF